MSLKGMEVFTSMLNSSVEDFNCILEVLKEQQSFSSNNGGDLISHINTLLGQHATRTKGLVLLSTVLDTSSGQLLLEKTSVCLPLCLAALKSPSEQPLCYSVTKQFLERFSTVHELERSSISSYLPEIIQSLAKCSSHAHLQALKMLETLLNKYSKPCGVHKSAVEKFLVPLVDSRDKQLVMHAAKCAHLLQQIRGGGEQGTNHKTAWISQYNLLLKTITTTLAALYGMDYSNEGDEVEKTISSNVGALQLRLEDLDSLTTLTDVSQHCNPVTLKALRLSTRLENLFVFLQAMIVEPFPVSKKLNCRHILDILMKCLSAVCGIPCASKTEPLLHCAIMNTLRALCVSLKGDILPYSSLLIRMILQTLEWSKTDDEETNVCVFKPFINVRKAAYRALTSLLKNIHSCRPPAQQGDLNVEDTLLASTLQDISPKTNVIQLTMTSVGGPKPMNKKARRKIAMAVNAQGMPDNVGQTSMRTNWSASNMELTAVAIDCLQAIYMCMGNFLKPNSHKLTQETIVGLLYDKETPIDVKKKLSVVLSAMMDFCGPTQSSVAAHCIHLYSSMHHNTSSELSWISQRELRSHLSSMRGHSSPLDLPAAPSPVSNTQDRRDMSTSFRSMINQSNSTVLAEANNVIEVGLDSSSDGSQDVVISESQSSKVSKKRKRSTDGGIVKKFTDRNINNSSSSVNTPEGKRSKVVVNPEESVEISDSSNSEKDEELIDTLEGSRENGTNSVDSSNNVEKQTELLNGNVDKLKNGNSTLRDIVDDLENDDVQNTSSNINENNHSPENLRLEIIDEEVEENVENKETVASIANNEAEDKRVSMEEMMNAFIDDVNEEMK